MTGEILVGFFSSIPMLLTVVPIVICSIISVAVIIERSAYFRRIDLDYRFIIENVSNYVKANDPDGAKSFCGGFPGPLVGVIAGVIDPIFANADREGVMLASTRNAVVAIEKYIGVIATVATISPMLGLFGTVTGLLKAFVAIFRGGPDASALLSYGVAEALITTVLGLLVAIPSWVFYNYMVARLEFFMRELEYVSNSIMKIEAKQ